MEPSVSNVSLASEPTTKFIEFLRSFKDATGRVKYRERIRRMILLRQRSLIIDFPDLMAYDRSLATSLLESPSEYIPALDRAITEVVKLDDMEYASSVTFHARLRALPETVPLRELRAEHIGKLVMIEGILTRASPVRQLLTEAVYQIGDKEGYLRIESPLEQVVLPGPKKKVKLLLDRCKFIDWQKLTVQEKPEDLPPGQLPRSVDVIVTDDLVDKARPGDRVSVIGIVKVHQERPSSPASFSIYIEANNIEVSESGLEGVEITPEDEKKILELAKDPDIHKKIIRSIAPSIYGNEDIKEAIAYQLFGGVPKVYPDGVKVRGDIHILLIGDPGTAKSQLLKYVARLAPRGIYTSGKGSTAAGLTAAVVRDKTSGEFYLEAGALVLSDKGIACIDELDKMNPQDRVSMHEAMEQQTISIAKAGIVATLNARCAILAAANPRFGRYINERPFNENIDEKKLPPTILSRFDLIFVLKDIPDEKIDSALADHVLSLHSGRVEKIGDIIPPDLLRKYIAYAREHVHPKLSKEAVEKIKEFYLEMRSKAKGGLSPIPITPRQLESLIRLTEARARMALREIATAEDAEAAIRLMKVCLSKVGYDEETGKIDIDIIMVGRPRSHQERLATIMDIIKKLEEEYGGEPVSIEEIYREAELRDIPKEFVDKSLKYLMEEGEIYEPRPGYVKRTRS
ncbi:MAG: Minichromosome maintenance protein MCM [Thermoprotei archaeon]|nr:MAG: Minichromosome maintenance protein MCM [Thermoprotei archaeon]RLF19531.1 MAG: Minichromosome maintenance protein MCM [Thermoprotei archaeon]